MNTGLLGRADLSTDRDRDPIYELELCRALIESERRRPTPNVVLVRGLLREVDYWMKKAVKQVNE